MILHGDCLEHLRTMESDSLDSLVTDPPAGIAFMGKDWDKDKGGRDAWVAWMTDVMRECLRVLKPGAHGLVWALPRTSHWTATALEDAGFEIRDVVTHLFGSGFPKSLDVSKAIDKAACAKREIVGRYIAPDGHTRDPANRNKRANYGTYSSEDSFAITAPATDSARQWQGWGTALKPASEHWILVRKPLGEKTVAANVLKHGTGALNIDGCRIPGIAQPFGNGTARSGGILGESTERGAWKPTHDGRFPANLVLTCCGNEPHDEDCAVRMLDEQSGTLVSKWGKQKTRHDGDASMFGLGVPDDVNRYSGDSGGASRFFYCAKASRSDRNSGLEGMPLSERMTTTGATRPNAPARLGADPHAKPKPEANTHPTVKSTKLMSYLIRLITPPGGVVLDPFAGSGSTGVAAKEEGFEFIGIEQSEEYAAIARERIGA